METLISWDELLDKDRVRMLMGRVLGWETFGSWEEYQRKYGAKEWGIGSGRPFTTSTHVAFCEYRHSNPDDYEWRVFSPDHEDLNVFDPLHNLNDAWLLMDALKPGRAGDTAGEDHETFLRRARFVDILDNTMNSWWSWPKERMCRAICQAAYEAVLAIEGETKKQAKGER